MSNHTVMGYSPSDFYFISVLNSSGQSVNCAPGGSNPDMSSELVSKICANEELVNTNTAQMTQHSGSKQALDDSQSKYNTALLNMLNMVVGIGGLTYFFVFGHHFAYGTPTQVVK